MISNTSGVPVLQLFGTRRRARLVRDCAAAAGRSEANVKGYIRPGVVKRQVELLGDTLEVRGLLSRFCATIREIRDFNLKRYTALIEK
eukprot:SAG31_NODE_6883_length_1861_cov_1.564699_2_plen_87_part_01